jgi:hypothetical protein
MVAVTTRNLICFTAFYSNCRPSEFHRNQANKFLSTGKVDGWMLLKALQGTGFNAELLTYMSQKFLYDIFGWMDRGNEE